MPSFLRLLLELTQDDFYRGLTHGVVEFDKDYIGILLDRRDMFEQSRKKDASLSESLYYDGRCRYFERLNAKLLLTRTNHALFEDNRYAPMRPTVMLPEDQEMRTEVDEVHILSDGVYWSAYPKHMGSLITTSTISYKTLEVYWKKFGGRRATG